MLSFLRARHCFFVVLLFLSRDLSGQPCLPITAVHATPMSPCQNSAVTLQVVGGEAGASFSWWSAPAGGSLLFTGNTWFIPAIDVSQTFYVQQTSLQSQPQADSFYYTGFEQFWTVPVGVMSVHLKSWGGQGGNGGVLQNGGGNGGFAEGDLAVTPGQVLSIQVGQKGGLGNSFTSGYGGYNGGGPGGGYLQGDGNYSGGGGGASDVRINQYQLADRVLVAPGGGGAGSGPVGITGGAGGALIGSNGLGSAGIGGGIGGSQVAAGDGGIGLENGASGDEMTGGAGAGVGSGFGGGGGGGYFGGGGGGAGTTVAGGGGGGSAYIGLVANGQTQGNVKTGDGLVVISYQAVCTYNPVAVNVLVQPLPASFAVQGGGAYCTQVQAGSEVALSGSEQGVEYQLLHNQIPLGPSVLGTGSSISFGEQALAGTYTVRAKNPVSGCENSMLGGVSISTFDCSIQRVVACACENNASATQAGQFEEEVIVQSSVAQNWVVESVIGLYQLDTVQGYSAVLIANGTPLLSMGNGSYQLKGGHTDGAGFKLVISNGLGAYLQVGDTCTYPKLSFPASLMQVFCLYSDTVSLSIVRDDQQILWEEFTVSGEENTVFDPGVGVGQYQIGYTVHGGQAGQFNDKDPGCVQSITTMVAVLATPGQLICNDQIHVSLDTTCTFQITPLFLLSTDPVCADNYSVALFNAGGNPIPGNTLGAVFTGQTITALTTHLVDGNQCTTEVLLEDYLAPKIACKNVSVPCNVPSLDPVYLAQVLGLADAVPVTNDCNSVVLSHTDDFVAVNCGDTIMNVTDLSGVVTRTWKINDVWNNQATCVQHIYVRRVHLQDIQLPAKMDLVCAPDVNTTPDITGLPSVSFLGNLLPLISQDGACSVHYTFRDVVFPLCGNSEGILRKWTLVDDCPSLSAGLLNPLEYNQLIRVVDSIGPVLNCPSKIRVSTDPFTCCAVFDLPDIFLSDGCSSIEKISGQVQSLAAGTGEILAEFTFQGALLPVLGDSVFATMGSTPCLGIGLHQVTYTALDACGNVGSCTFSLFVDDCTPPVAVCDGLTVVNLGIDDLNDCYVPSAINPCKSNGVAWVKASVFDDGSYDNCSNLRFTARRLDTNSPCINSLNSCERVVAKTEADSIKFYACEVGTIQTIQVRVYQANFNPSACGGEVLYNDCNVQVEVRDKLKPVCQAPADVTVACSNFDATLTAYGNVLAYDNVCLDPGVSYLGQCGVQATTNMDLYDLMCKRGVIRRTFIVTDCSGNTSTCAQQITVENDPQWSVKFPDDQTVSVCDTSGAYGLPAFQLTGCGQIAFSYQDVLLPAGGQGCYMLERRWTIWNECVTDANQVSIDIPNPVSAAVGPIVSAPGTVFPWVATQAFVQPNDPNVTDYAIFWSENSRYSYKQNITIKDTTAPVFSIGQGTKVVQQDFSGNDPAFWNGNGWLDSKTGAENLSEASVELEIAATDDCSGTMLTIDYLLSLDLDQDGVLETVIDSKKLGNQGLGWNQIPFGNAVNPGFSGGEIRAMDHRQVANNQQYGFALETKVIDGKKYGYVRWNTAAKPTEYTLPLLPNGKHAIRWILEDLCGNQQVLDQTILIEDKQAPTLTCKAGFNAYITPNQTFNVDVAALIQQFSDNYTPVSLLETYGANAQASIEYTTDSMGISKPYLKFDCADLGLQNIVVWAVDLDGNSRSCTTFVTIKDQYNFCQDSTKVFVGGKLQTSDAKPVSGAQVEIISQLDNFPAFSNSVYSDWEGWYSYDALPPASNLLVQPLLNQNPLNGVTTYDLLQINKHILALQPFVSPYQVIAADANHSNTVTTFDIVELRKLILGVYQQFANNTSWRFVDKAHVFPVPGNPFQAVFPEFISMNQQATDVSTADFVAVKVGDVNSSAVGSANAPSEARTFEPVWLETEDRLVRRGDQFSLHFRTDQPIASCQFTLELHGLSLLEIQAAGQMSTDQFGVLGDALTIAYTADPRMQITSDGFSFSLLLEAQTDAPLHDLLRLSDRITLREAYTAPIPAVEFVKMQPNLRFLNAPLDSAWGQPFELYQNYPNPFHTTTSIGFQLPQAGEAVLSVLDATGILVHQQRNYFSAGYHALEFEMGNSPQFGLFYYKIETPFGTLYRKLVHI